MKLLTPLAQQMAKASGSTGISGGSTRKSECHLPARLGTSPRSTASRWTSLSARSGTAKTPRQCYRPDCSRRYRRRPPRYNAQKPKVSVRWQPMDPKYIGALTLRGSYSEAFHAPTLAELTPASSQSFPIVADPFSRQTEPQIEERILGNPNLHPETAYEWTYGAVYSPKWVKGLTVSADWWHIDMRDIVTNVGAQTIILQNPPPTNGASSVITSTGSVFRSAGSDPTVAGASRSGDRS